MKIRTIIPIGTAVAVLCLAALASAQPLPEDPAGGGLLFQSKGCVKCHAVKGAGGTTAPDLGRIDSGDTQLGLAARIWNHTPSMLAGMEQAGIARPTLTGQEFTEIVAYLYFLRFFDAPGDAASGKYLFGQKGCSFCHAVSGRGREGGLGLDEFPRNITPVFLSQAIWNHSLEMMARMAQVGKKWPDFAGTEMMDLLEYIRANAKGPEEPAFLKPGNPREGKRIFDAKGCVKCHSIRGEGAAGGIDLGKRAEAFYTSLTQVASSMWNKGPEILVRITQTQCGLPKFTPQEMADLTAYLYFLHYADGPGNASAGKRLFSTMGCAQCHGLEGKRGKLMYIDLSKYRYAAPTEIVASIWNHSMKMRRAVGEQGLSWPQLKREDMVDLLEFLRSPAGK